MLSTKELIAKLKATGTALCMPPLNIMAFQAAVQASIKKYNYKKLPEPSIEMAPCVVNVTGISNLIRDMSREEIDEALSTNKGVNSDRKGYDKIIEMLKTTKMRHTTNYAGKPSVRIEITEIDSIIYLLEGTKP